MPGTLRVSIVKLSCAPGAVANPHVAISLGLQTVKTPIPEVEPDAAAASPRRAGSDKVYHSLKLSGPKDRFSISIISGDGSKLGTARIGLDDGSPSLLEQAYFQEDKDLKLAVEVINEEGDDVGRITITLKYFLIGEEEGHLESLLDARWQSLKQGDASVPQTTPGEVPAMGEPASCTTTKTKVKHGIKNGFLSFFELLSKIPT